MVGPLLPVAAMAAGNMDSNDEQGFPWGSFGMGTLGFGLDLAEKIWGKSEQEKRQEWLEEMAGKADQAYDRGLRSRSQRFARLRTLSGVDREAASVRSRASGSGARARQRMMSVLGLAGMGMAESVGGGIEQAGNAASFDLLSKRLGEFETTASQMALGEAQGRQQSILAAMYAQPLQSHAAGQPQDSGYGDLMGDVSSWWSQLRKGSNSGGR